MDAGAVMKLVSALALCSLLALASACSSSTPPDPGGAPPAGDDAGAAQTKDAAASNPGYDAGAPDAAFTCDPAAAPGSFFELSSPDLGQSRVVSMCEFRGDVILVVNVASKCGYTPEYTPLEAVYEKYASQGFTILGFPCNQFGGQEPGSDQDISTFCTQQYGITFPMFTKSDVNAPDENPIYTWLKAQPGGAGDITWNFNKFLLGRDGELIARYDSPVQPDSAQVTGDIEAALAK